MTDIATIERLGQETSTPAPDVYPTLEEIRSEIWASRIDQIVSDFSRICRERAKEILSTAMEKIDWSDIAVVVFTDGVDPQTVERRLRESFAQVLAEEIVG